jgi:CheY-like chemotaxis protein
LASIDLMLLRVHAMHTYPTPRSFVTSDHPAGRSLSSSAREPQTEQVALVLWRLLSSLTYQHATAAGAPPRITFSAVALVLVVDDEPDVRLIARLVLTSAGYDVIEAESGEAALAHLKGDQRPMRGIDGWETLRRMRSEPSQSNVPVVIFTAQLANASDAPKPWKDYDHFLTKPFDPDGLLEAVKAAIGPSGD